MHFAFAVYFVLITYVVSYPSSSLREVSINDEENNNDLELELRSILNHLDNEQEERTLTSDEDDSDENENAMIKRQGGYNIIKPDLKCEIECVGNVRDPNSEQKKMSIKDAANICKNMCSKTNKKREQKISFGQRKEESHQKNLREFTNDNDDDDNSNSNEKQLREFSDYLMEQLQLNHIK